LLVYPPSTYDHHHHPIPLGITLGCGDVEDHPVPVQFGYINSYRQTALNANSGTQHSQQYVASPPDMGAKTFGLFMV